MTLTLRHWLKSFVCSQKQSHKVAVYICRLGVIEPQGHRVHRATGKMYPQISLIFTD